MTVSAECTNVLQVQYCRSLFSVYLYWGIWCVYSHLVDIFWIWIFPEQTFKFRPSMKIRFWQIGCCTWLLHMAIVITKSLHCVNAPSLSVRGYEYHIGPHGTILKSLVVSPWVKGFTWDFGITIKVCLIQIVFYMLTDKATAWIHVLFRLFLPPLVIWEHGKHMVRLYRLYWTKHVCMHGYVCLLTVTECFTC